MNAIHRQPNIVFITTDTQGQNMVSAYGKRGGVDTPNIDRLAGEGVLFENAFCASPVCTPARGAWYSGMHPNRNGAWTNGMAVGRNTPLLAERLTGTGYRCVHLGKWHLEGGGYNGDGEPDGGFGEPWYDLTNYHQEHPQDGPNRFGAWNRGLQDIESCFGHCVADRAIDVISTHREGPLFLAVEFDEPHGPFICPPPFRGRFSHEEVWRPATLNADMAGKPKLQQEYAAFLRTHRANPEDLPAYYSLYHDCNSYVDHEIGRVLDAVDRYMPDDTVVIYTADHGDHHGAFGLCAKGPTLYDTTCAVPFIVRAPHLNGSLLIDHCGDAEIVMDAWYAGYEAPITVQGPTSSGFIGIHASVASHCDPDITVKDSASIVFGDFYTEQTQVHVLAAGAPDDSPGRLTLSNAKLAGGPGSTLLLLANSYFYSEPAFQREGDAVIRLLGGIVWRAGGESGNLILDDRPGNPDWASDVNAALDHFRELSLVELGLPIEVRTQ